MENHESALKAIGTKVVVHSLQANLFDDLTIGSV